MLHAEINQNNQQKMSGDSFSDDEHIEPPSFSLATLGLQRVGTAPPPKPQAPFPKQTLNARGMPARIRKRNRLFFDDNIVNDDKPLRQSLSPRKKDLKLIANGNIGQQQQVLQQYVPKSPGKIMKTQKPLNKIKSEKSANKLKLQQQHKNVANEEIRNSSMRFRNILKLPKPHNWIINEFFTSFIDKPLLESGNEFQSCLKHEVPQLNQKELMRGEWIILRSLMGKPRRCSARFLAEERRSLENKRKKIRYLQSHLLADQKDLNFIRDLPEKIPLNLPVGTKVQARLYGLHQNGVQYGSVDAFNSQSSTYRITFENPGTGKQTIHDSDIKSENFFEMLPLQSISKEYRSLNALPGCTSGDMRTPLRKDMRGLRSALSMNLNKSDPLLTQEVYDSPYKNPVLQRDNINGRPVALLELIVRLRHALINKRGKLQRLDDMNHEAEMRGMANKANTIENSMAKLPNGSSDESENNFAPGSICTDLSEDFQRRYASIIISLERVNRDIQDYFYEIQKFATELTRDPQEQASLVPTYLREKCREEAEVYVASQNHAGVKNPNTLNLVRNLTTILVVASHLGSAEDNGAQVPKVLEGCMEEVKSSLYASNVGAFQKNVQLHLHHIRLGIGQNALMNNGNINQ